MRCRFGCFCLPVLTTDFAGCIAMLDAMADGTPTSLYGEVGVGACVSRSVEILRGECERYLRDGCPDDFDGVFRALEK